MLLTVRAVAETLNVNRSTVYELINAGKINCHRVGVGRGVIRISEADLDEYLASCRPAQQTEQTPRRRVKLKHLSV